MKSRILLPFIVFFATALTLSAQTFHIEWNGGSNIIFGSENDAVVKLEGFIVNDNSTPKAFYFTYDLNETDVNHYVSLCFKGGTGDQCFFLFRDEDDPTLRPLQTVTGNGRLGIYCDLNPLGVMATSKVLFELYDPEQASERLPFSITFYVGTTDVPEATEAGFRVGPNPATDIVNVVAAEGMAVEGANLYTADGTLVRTYGVQPSANTFSLSGLASGTYHLILNVAGGSTSRTSVVIAR
jgi:hypothetical protein